MFTVADDVQALRELEAVPLELPPGLARAYGSPSLAHLIRLHGLGGHAVEVRADPRYGLVGPALVPRCNPASGGPLTM